MKEEFRHCCRVIIIREWSEEFSKDEECKMSVMWKSNMSQGGKSIDEQDAAMEDAFE
jgi:hypothetical protein